MAFFRALTSASGGGDLEVVGTDSYTLVKASGTHTVTCSKPPKEVYMAISRLWSGVFYVGYLRFDVVNQTILTNIGDFTIYPNYSQYIYSVSGNNITFKNEVSADWKEAVEIYG